MKSAVIATGGKQYLVHEGDTIKVEKLSAKEGKTINFEEVLLAATDKTTKIGTPHVKGAAVTGKVVLHGRHQKITGVKMKPKKRNRKLYGHKQHYTAVEITKIKTS